MKIIIAGAGDVGCHLARMLSGDNHEITVIESDRKLLEDVSAVADLLTVEGDCTSFATLRKAIVRKADLFIAVNHEEERNIISAILAKQMGAKKSIARIDHNEYLEPNNKEVFINLGIDYLFYPEKIAARQVIKLLGHTATTEYVDFSNGKLSLVVFRLDPASELVGHTLLSFTEKQQPLSYRTVAITRDGRTIIPHGNDTYMEGDMVYIITKEDSVKEVMAFSGQSNIDINNLMILGGSQIGQRIALELQDKVNIKLVEYIADKAYKLAETLDSTLIINEDGRNIEAMMEEGLSNMDAFVAVTGRSETNILAAMLAKRMGVKKVIAEVENLNYIKLAESIGIDTIINKKLITASNIFRFTLSTDVQAIKCLTGSEAEVLEFIVKPNSPATKAKVKDMDFPTEAIIGGIVRGDKVFIAVGNTEIQAYDRVVVFAMPNTIAKIGKYFN
ncbi:MAG: Trk system potassium transporter TrkA [Rikenellaceae bacterium]|nr:Trk system potassium transporter TrkA [Rikenellaceae bacterium]MBR6662287.1 Trk system potassium transporter TrkA [Alistipes sp.]MBQ6690692.1 Trk system potassium transporter TrkA [Rikenellaceae bacterium]MBQ7791207.1 Trk system potassium transporter TrkA [Rikenellaceae bacterium]MBQ9146273.1 Trk system potassium transporter TrkA [Rikenellaceae bacterium]